MKITKFVHACLLVETDQRVGLFDPGDFSYKSGLFNIDSLHQLDDIIITHEHPDHMFVPFIKALVKKFPDVQIITTPPAAAILQSEGISALTESTASAALFDTKHEPMAPLGQPPANIGVHYMQQLTHPGDSHHFTESMEILALPITAPWGTLARAAEVGVELRPQTIIPIHDWHLRDEARNGFYDRLENFFQDHGIRFLKPVHGEPFEA